MTFSKSWLKAIGKDPETHPQPQAKPFIFLGVSLLMIAWVLAGVIGHLGKGQVTLWNGTLSGIFIWAGFVATPMATNYAFQGRPFTLTLIDGGHFLLVLIVQGAIIGWFGI